MNVDVYSVYAAFFLRSVLVIVSYVVLVDMKRLRRERTSEEVAGRELA